MSVTEKEFKKSLKSFLKKYKRLPYLKEDVLTFVQGDTERDLVAHSRIKKFCKDDLITYCFDNEIINNKYIASRLRSTETRVQNIINAEVKNPDIDLRSGIEMILGKDFYSDILSVNHPTCDKCKKKCKQKYNVMLSCRKFDEK